MSTFIGTKQVHGTPMTRLEYNEYRNWTLPEDENGDDTGYLVEQLGDVGHVAWLPSDVFEDTYQDVTRGVSFGDAVILLKEGKKVARLGWNGEGMFAYYVPANEYPAASNPYGVMRDYFIDDMVPYRAYLALKTAQNDVAMWTPSISDVLADDWILVE